MINFLLSAVLSMHVCKHDEFMSKMMARRHILEKNKTKTKEFNIIEDISSKRKPIRVHFDFDYLDEKNPFRCNEVGEIVDVWGEKKICYEYDILDNQKKQVIIESIGNLQNYLSKIIKVRPALVINPYLEFSDFLGPDKDFTDTDFYVAVSSVPYGKNSGIIAQCGSLMDESFPRPFAGNMILNLLYIPKTSQNYDSTDRSFFLTLFHEFSHALGISDLLYPLWEDQNGNRYGDSIMKNCTIDGTNHQVTILHTPILEKYVKERWGIDKFSESCPAGVELENNGGEGTALSHPENRVYYGEVMVGYADDNLVISDLVLLMLQSTGWYDINMSFAEPLSWGHRSTNPDGQKPMKDFPFGIPRKKWPNNYIISTQESMMEKCSYNLRAISQLSNFWYQYVGNPVLDKEKSFYDPDNTNYVGPYFFVDYVPFGPESILCNDANFDYRDKYNNYSDESICMMSSLNEYIDYFNLAPQCYFSECINDELYIYVHGVKKKCSNETTKLKFDGIKGYIQCPDPVFACGIKHHLRSTPEFNFGDEYTSIQPVLPSDCSSRTPIIGPVNDGNLITKRSNKETNLIILGAIIAGIIVIIVVASVIVRCKWKESIREYSEDDNDNKTAMI